MIANTPAPQACATPVSLANFTTIDLASMNANQLFDATKTVIALRHMLSMQRTDWALHLLDGFVDTELSALVSEVDRRMPTADDEDLACYRSVKIAAHAFLPMSYTGDQKISGSDWYA